MGPFYHHVFKCLRIKVFPWWLNLQFWVFAGWCFIKVRIFWGGHKILIGFFFFKFCGLLRISELHFQNPQQIRSRYKILKLSTWLALYSLFFRWKSLQTISRLKPQKKCTNSRAVNHNEREKKSLGSIKSVLHFSWSSGNSWTLLTLFLKNKAQR